MKSYKINFKDYAGNDVTETYYFNLTETEISFLNARYNGSIMHTLARLTRDNSQSEAMNIMLDVLKTAYGVMDDDQRHFRKANNNPAIWDDFTSSPGFDKFFVSVFGDDTKCAEFIEGIMPEKARKSAENTDEQGLTAREKFDSLTAADVTIE